MELQTPLFKISKERVITPPSHFHTFLLKKDSKSTVLTFQIYKFYDGVDLSSKRIRIYYKNALEQISYDDAEEISSTKSTLTFQWRTDESVAAAAGSAEFWVEFSDAEQYLLKTKTCLLTVEDSLNIELTAKEVDYTLEHYLLENRAERIELPHITDDSYPCKIEGRSIDTKHLKNLAVQRDNLSQLITFRIKRYQDGIDLYDKIPVIYYKNAQNQTDFSVACNIKASKHELYFGWLLDNKVTAYSGEVAFQIGFLSKEEGKIYALHTKIASFQVEEGLSMETFIEPPEESWYQSFLIQADSIIKLTSKSANAAKQYAKDSKDLKAETSILLSEVTQQHTDLLSQAKSLLSRLEALQHARPERMDKDQNGIFRTIYLRRPDGTLLLKSTLSGGNSPKYSKRSEILYDTDGMTILENNTYHLLYDTDQALIKEV